METLGAARPHILCGTCDGLLLQVSVTEWKQNISDVCQMKTGCIRQKLADKRTNGRVV